MNTPNHDAIPSRSPTKISAFGDDPHIGVPASGTELEVSRAAAQMPAVGPVDTYLASLAESSRRPQLSALNAVAGFLSRGRATAHTFPWWEVTYPASQAVRAHFASRLSPATTNRYLSCLRSVMTECWRLRMISAEELARACDVRNVRGLRLPAGRALERPEIADLLAACRADPRPAGRRDEAIVATLWTTGMRRAELVGLDLADLSVDHATITVVGKGNKEREVYLNEEAVGILDRWLDLRGVGAGALFNAVNKAGVIRVQGHLSPSTVRDILLRRADQAGVAPFAPHSMRRTHASEMLDRTDVLTVQKLGGWSPASTSVLSRYDKRSTATARAAIDGLKLPA